MTYQVNKMVEILGTESGNAWLDFMDYTHEVLAGIVDKRGAPSAETIANSIIGEAGFTSWKAMIQASTAEGGLGWNLSSWDLWKRAYRIVQQHPYLRELELTASEIKTLHNETKDSFPADLEAFNDYQANRMEIIESKRQNSLSNAKKVNDELVLELSTLKEQVSHLSQQLETSSQDNQRLSADLTTSTKSITDLTAENAVLNTKLESAQKLLIEHGEEVSSLKAALEKLQKNYDTTKSNAEKRNDRITKYNSLHWLKKLITFSI
jgi:myosin heavy subunit